MREDGYREFKKMIGELNEAMVSVSAMLNKHKHGSFELQSIFCQVRTEGLCIIGDPSPY